MSTNVQFTFPHYEINTKDNSIYVPLYREELPLHRPLFTGRSQSGPIGIPKWYSTVDHAKRIIGAGTFDIYSDYYSRTSVFMQYNFEKQGCFFNRVADDTAKASSVLISCKVTPTTVPQYEKDEYGNFTLDTSGNKIPIMDGENPVTVAGYKLTWIKSVIAADVDISTIQPTTTVDGQVTTHTFPIIAIRASYFGKYGDGLGFKLKFDANILNASQIERIKSLLYSFYPVKKTYNQDTVSAVRSIDNLPYATVSMRPDANDVNYDRNFSIDSVLSKDYWSSTMNENLLPYNIHVYSNYINTIATNILAVESVPDTTEPFLIDIFTGKDKHGSYLDSVIMDYNSSDATNVVFNENYVIYLSGGSDGDITDSNIETLTRQYFTDLTNPDILDSARFPITHLYDDGVSLNTKKAFIDFLGQKEDLKVILATQDCSTTTTQNTAAEDRSIGASLHSYALLQPESVSMGTGCCRCEIYQQSGYLNDDTRYKGYLPATLDALIKRRDHQCTTSIVGDHKGLPNSKVSIFKVSTINWLPVTNDTKQESWDLGLNYMQAYDRYNVHYADTRTVYSYDTSVLCSTVFTDALIYSKHIIRYNWAVHSGKELPFEILATQCEKTTLKDLLIMLNGKYKASIVFYRTEEEQKIGFITHAKLDLTGYGANRVWVVDIICNREGYTPEDDA